MRNGEKTMIHLPPKKMWLRTVYIITPIHRQNDTQQKIRAQPASQRLPASLASTTTARKNSVISPVIMEAL